MEMIIGEENGDGQNKVFCCLFKFKVFWKKKKKREVKRELKRAKWVLPNQKIIKT